MCTLVILRRPEHEWPVIIGANRDEGLAQFLEEVVASHLVEPLDGATEKVI